MTTKSAAKPPCVTVIADKPETIDALCTYLSRAGVVLHASRDLHDACTAPLAASAVVLFPDEYDVDDAVASITSLRAARPRLLILIVTSAPQRFRSLGAPSGRSRPAIVLPKPTFGWTLLDAIRAHALSEAP